MRIKKLEIISFGKFKNKVIDFSEGLNIIYGDNESGKSTTISFIYAMLYGFGESRTKALSLREKYTPWDGGVCEGKMIVETDDKKRISIYRKAGNVKKYDILLVHDADTGEELSLLPADIIGVESDTFFKTLFIRQLGSTFDCENDEIAQKLSNISSGGDEGVSFDKASKILDSIRREIQPQRGGGGEYAEITKKISDAKKSLDAKKNARAELSSIAPFIVSEEKKIKELEEKIKLLSQKDYSSRIAHISGRLEEMEKSGGRKFLIIPSILLLSFTVLLFTTPEYSVISLILFILSAVFSAKSQKRKNAEKIELVRKKETLIEKKTRANENLSHLEKEISLSKSRLLELKVREEALRRAAENEGEDTDDLYRKKEVLERKLRIISLISRALSAANDNMKKNFTPALNRKASEYFSLITGGKYEHVFCDKEFSLSIESTIPRESGFFSGGTVDQLYLSLRLALIDMLFGEEGCPIILDQPFLQYDETRKKSAISLFESIKSCRQIILFTADKSLTDRNI